MKDNMISNSALFNRKQGGKKGPTCALKDMVIDYKNLSLLVQKMTEKGRIMPSRISSVSRKQQRKLKLAIKRARNLALLPFVAK